MRIYIPSSGRPTKQTTLASLPSSMRADVFLVVPPEEWQDYTKANPAANIYAPDIPKGIGPARQWCIENGDDDHKVLMLDDDLVFATRRLEEPTKFRDAAPMEVTAMLYDVANRLNTYASVGLATREGGNRNIENYDHDTRLLRVLAFRTDILAENNIRFDQIGVMEDFYVSLSLLTRGYGNCKINYMVQNQHGSGLVGGCSQYRDWQTQADAAHALKDAFPQFVRVEKKQTKDNWCADPEGFRTDVTIYWKKALKSAMEVQVVLPK